MSFLKIGDRAAGAIKSGGTTRRAAKMVVVDVDHPDIEDLHRLEGEGGAEGRGPRHRLEDRCQKHLKAIMKACVNCDGRAIPASTRQEPGAEARDPRRQEEPRCRKTTSKRVIQFAKQGYTDISSSDLRHRLGFGSLPHRLRPELQQLRARDRRLPEAPWRTTATGPDRPQGRQGHEDPEGPRAVGADRLRRLGVGRSRHPVPHHHQRLAHLPGRGRRSAPPTRARNTCSSTTRPATSPR
jgi:hypothetical protein